MTLRSSNHGRHAGLAVFLLLFAVPGGGQAAERWIPFTIIEGRDADLSGLSRIGRQVLRDPNEWMIGRSEHFLVFGANRPELSRAVDEAENARRYIADWLDLAPVKDRRRSLLVFMRNAGEWDRLMRGHGLRPDSLAMQVGDELYFKDDPEQAARPDRVAHEVIHLELAARHAGRIPLWLDEGLASHFGWKCAVVVSNQRELMLYRNRPSVPAAHLFALEELLAMDAYPEDPARAAAFYRQGEELVAVLEARLGSEGLARFVRVMSSGRNRGLVQFRRAAGLASADIDAIVREVEVRCGVATGN